MPKGIKKHIDYLNLYNLMLGEPDSLVKGSQNSMDSSDESSLSFYINQLRRWEASSVFPYSFTLSPKSSPLLKNKSSHQQYSLIQSWLRQVLPLYSNKYFMTFETYSDNVNLHVHGFMQFRILDNITKFKRDAKQHFNIKLQKREKDPLTHIKLIGNDFDQRKRWIGYIYKEMQWALKNHLNPIFRWDDLYIQPILSIKTTKKKQTICLSSSDTYYSHRQSSCGGCNNCHKCKPPKINIIWEELESETEEQPEQITTTQYLLYLKLKSQFENKNI